MRCEQYHSSLKSELGSDYDIVIARVHSVQLMAVDSNSAKFEVKFADHKNLHRYFGIN